MGSSLWISSVHIGIFAEKQKRGREGIKAESTVLGKRDGGLLVKHDKRSI